jgi:hypothetical protein
MACRPTRFLLFQYCRIKKKLYKWRELWQLQRQPANLRHFEKRIYSQNGEDGILEEVFRRVGTTNRFFVECGAQDGIQCCTRNLLENFSWTGVWIDCVTEHAVNAKSMFEKFPVTIIERFLTAENIVSVFREAGVVAEPDLMSIDVDGNEYWLWKALAEYYRPRVVITEYNATFGAKAEWVIPYDPQHRYDGTAYTGASLNALAVFGKQNGYSLVGCESTGVNALFVRDDVAAQHFGELGKPVSCHYVAPHFDWWFGHPLTKLT